MNLNSSPASPDPRERLLELLGCDLGRRRPVLSPGLRVAAGGLPAAAVASRADDDGLVILQARATLAASLLTIHEADCPDTVVLELVLGPDTVIELCRQLFASLQPAAAAGRKR